MWVIVEPLSVVYLKLRLYIKYNKKNLNPLLEYIYSNNFFKMFPPLMISQNILKIFQKKDQHHFSDS